MRELHITTRARVYYSDTRRGGGRRAPDVVRIAVLAVSDGMKLEHERTRRRREIWRPAGQLRGGYACYTVDAEELLQ